MVVSLDGRSNFFGIGGSINPGVCEVGGSERGVVVELFGVLDAHLAIADENPDGNSGTCNAGFSAADAGGFADAAPVLAEALGQDLDGGKFIGGREGEEVLSQVCFLVATFCFGG